MLLLILLLLHVLPHTDPQIFIGTLATGQTVTRRGRHGLGKFHAALAALVTTTGTNIDRPARTFRRHAVANEAEAHVAYGGVGSQISAGGGNQYRSESGSVLEAVQDVGHKGVISAIVSSVRPMEGVGRSHVLDVVVIIVSVCIVVFGTGIGC